jgi:hypothetical protein
MFNWIGINELIDDIWYVIECMAIMKYDDELWCGIWEGIWIKLSYYHEKDILARSSYVWYMYIHSCMHVSKCDEESIMT